MPTTESKLLDNQAAEQRKGTLIATDADAAKAREIIGNVNNYAEDGELSVSAFGPLSTRIAEALATVRKEAREAAEKVGRQAFAAELLGHLDRVTSTTAAYHFVRNICKIELDQKPDSLGAEVD